MMTADAFGSAQARSEDVSLMDEEEEENERKDEMVVKQEWGVVGPRMRRSSENGPREDCSLLLGRIKNTQLLLWDLPEIKSCIF